MTTAQQCLTLCVKCDIKPYTLTHSLTRQCLT